MGRAWQIVFHLLASFNYAVSLPPTYTRTTWVGSMMCNNGSYKVAILLWNLRVLHNKMIHSYCLSQQTSRIFAPIRDISLKCAATLGIYLPVIAIIIHQWYWSPVGNLVRWSCVCVILSIHLSVWPPYLSNC